MIQFVQTGEFRTRTIRIKRFINTVETAGDGFPLVESLLDSFADQPSLSEEQLIDLTTNQFSVRVDAFKAYLLAKYSWLSPGDFINSAGGTDNATCIPGTVTGSGSIVITQDTEIIIFFDSSGSMNSTLAPLIEMRNTLLKTALLPFYNMDSVLYDQKVMVISDSSEETFHMLNNRGNSMANNQLIMVFQDESNNDYHSSSSFTPRKPKFEADITALRATIQNREPNSYRGVIFQVDRSHVSEGVQFKSLMQAVKNGSVDYPLPYNLSDRPEVAFQFDVVNGSTPQYYMDLLLLKMRELGYRI